MQPVRASRYHWPRGYRYQRYARGGRISSVYFSPDYYIVDYDYYGVDAPPADYEWIRYGPDLMLVDIISGDIANVIYGVFEEADTSEDQGDYGNGDGG